MIGIFRNNLFFNSLLLLPYIFIIRVHSLIYPIAFEANESTSYVTRQIYNYIDNPLTQNIIACFLLFFQASLINRMAIQNRLSRLLTLIPGVFFVLFSSFLPEFTYLSDYMIANTFVILSITELMKVYNKPTFVSNVFNSGVFLGFAIILVPQYSFLSLFGLLAVLVLNSINLKNIMQYISGIITIMLLVFGIEYLIDLDVSKELALFQPGYNDFLFSTKTLLSTPVIFLNVLILISILGYNSYGVKKSIQSQRKIDLLYYFMLSVFISVVFSHDVSVPHMLVMFIPLSILLAMSFLDIKNNAIGEMLHLGLLVLLFLFQFNIIQF